MGRQSKGNATSANDLVNFHFSSPERQQQQQYYNNNNNNGRRQYNNNNNNNNYRNNNRNNRGGGGGGGRGRGGGGGRGKQAYNYRTAEDLASARRKANSAMFTLHSSADHAFVLTRRSASRMLSSNSSSSAAMTSSNVSSSSFSGCDNPVSWDSVLTVIQYVPLNSPSSSTNNNNKISTGTNAAATAAVALDDASSAAAGCCCPVCLCDYCCARITKCGHSFCFPCILQHVQVSTTTNPYQHVKCPCCGIPLIVEDLRPVVFEMVTTPTLHKKIKCVKLHRKKSCPAPFLPFINQPKHCSPISAPTIGEDDCKFTRFMYVDPVLYESILIKDMTELQNEINVSSPTTIQYINLAMQLVAQLQQKAAANLVEELELQKRFQAPTSGIYQPQSSHLVLQQQQKDDFNTYFGNQEESENGQDYSPPLGNNDHYNDESHNGQIDEEPPTLLEDETTADVSENNMDADNVLRRNRTSSVGSYKSETSQQQQQQYHRHRTDSVCSYKSETSHHTNNSYSNSNNNNWNEQQGSTPTSPRGSTRNNNKHYNNNKNRRYDMPLEKYFGSMFLEDPNDYVHFYQTDDGQLVFLSGFNMTCLSNDFAKEPFALTNHDHVDDHADLNNNATTTIPSSSSSSPNQKESHNQQQQQVQQQQQDPSLRRPRPPFPDVVEGMILHMEKIHVTHDVRKRMAFLSHLPLYIDVCFVELDLNHMLSDATKAKFKADIIKRKKRRQQKIQAEKKADKAALEMETLKIQERKARYQRVDPNDDFFKPVIVTTTTTTTTNGDENNNNINNNELFPEMEGHGSLQASSSSSSPPARQQQSLQQQQQQPVLASTAALNFSRACRRAENRVVSDDFPALGGGGGPSSSAFPALGSSSSAGPRTTPTTANRSTWASPSVTKPIGVGTTAIQQQQQQQKSPYNLNHNSGKKKKGKGGPKTVLFSTGGQRGMY